LNMTQRKKVEKLINRRIEIAESRRNFARQDARYKTEVIAKRSLGVDVLEQEIKDLEIRNH
jgi:polyhydroxyalkanoate synthesis regulator phasin